MKILLVNPWIHDFAAYDLWIKPLGLLYLAGVLQKQEFDLWYIDCLDDRVHDRNDGRAKFRKHPLPTPFALTGIQRQYGRYGISPEKFRGQLSQIPTPDAILVTSGMTYWYPGVQEAIRELRNCFPHPKIVLGGIYATLMADHARQYSGADVVVSGQFENGIVSLLIGGSNPWNMYPALDDLPLPAWNLVPSCNYRVLLTSRGCPYRCTFCASDILNADLFIQRSVANVVGEIEQYYFVDGIRQFVFYDDALLMRKRSHIIPLLSEIVSRNIRASFHTPNGLNAREIDETVASLFYQTGFRTIRISLESSDHEIQQIKGDRKVSNVQFEHAVKNLYAADYRPGDIECYLILGLPDQSLESVRNSLRFVSDLGVIARLAVFSPIPGTAEAEEAKKRIGDHFIREPLLQNHACFPLSKVSFGPEELQQIKHECNENNRRIAAYTEVC